MVCELYLNKLFCKKKCRKKRGEQREPLGSAENGKERSPPAPEGTPGEAFEKWGHWAQWGEQRQSYWAENICVLFSGREKGHEAKASSKALGFQNLPHASPKASGFQGLTTSDFSSPRAQVFKFPGSSGHICIGQASPLPLTPKPPPESGGTWLKWGSRGDGSRGVIQEGKEQPPAQNWV